jgi:hypothetical protein
MILQKNPQGKTDAKEVKNLILNANLREVNLVQDNWTGKKVEVITVKTSRGEYTHPVNMNAEMARRFELLERFSNISNCESRISNERSRSLQGLYAQYKSMPLEEVKKIKSYLRRGLKPDQPMGYYTNNDPFEMDQLYVIENLLKL